MAGQRYTLTFDANLNINQMKSALSQIQSSLNGLHLPQNLSKGLQGSFDNLKKELQGFEAIMGKDITGKNDFHKLETQANKVTTAYEKLKQQVKSLSGVSSRDIEKLFPESVSKNINAATTAIKNYSINMQKAKTAVTDATSSVDKFKAKHFQSPPFLFLCSILDATFKKINCTIIIPLFQNYVKCFLFKVLIFKNNNKTYIFFILYHEVK